MALRLVLISLVLPMTALSQILTEDIDQPNERKAYHLLCAATAGLSLAEVLRTAPEESETSDNELGISPRELLTTLGQAHLQEAQTFDATDEEYNVAAMVVRLLNNAGVMPFEERFAFLADHCIGMPNE